ncbi:MAG: SIS domain-containing protein [Candidatus Rokubacteria bacterium]|nr:SIS domain-containing protein [Candidatus Rokubacteria bacterium]
MAETQTRLDFIEGYFRTLVDVIAQLPRAELARALEVLETAWAERRRVFIAGNGGSAATASHMANDLMKGVAKGGAVGVRAIALSDNVALITAIANDEDYREIFAGQLDMLAEPGDVLIAITGSGNSPNVVRAVESARRLGVHTIGFLGMSGGQVGKMVDVAVVVPSDDYGPIEDLHMVFDHLMTAYLRRWAGGAR